MNKRPIEMLIKYADDHMLISGLMEDYITQVLCQRYREFYDDYVNIHIIPYNDVPYCYDKNGEKINSHPKTYKIFLCVTEKQLCEFLGNFFQSKFIHKQSDKHIFFYWCKLVNDKFVLSIDAIELVE